MGRRKIELKKIENAANRQVTFAKRRRGLLKKAHEISILCDAQVAIIIFSSTGKPFEYLSSGSSIKQILERYQRSTSAWLLDIAHQQLLYDMTRIKNENERLQNSLRHMMGEDLNTLSTNELHHLEQNLEIATTRVRARKDQLLRQQLEKLTKKLAGHHFPVRGPVNTYSLYCEGGGPNPLHMTSQHPALAFCPQPSQPNLQSKEHQQSDLRLGFNCARHQC